MLSGLEIQRQVEAGKIVIQDFNLSQLNPNSYNLRLDNKLLVYGNRPAVQTSFARPATEFLSGSLLVQDRAGRAYAANWTPIEEAKWVDVLDMAVEPETYELLIPENGLVLVPGRLYLGSTVEYTETHGFVPCIEGRSSIGRLGISVHVTAGFGDIGFCGTWTLEITVAEPIRIYANIQICQICYDSVEGDHVPYQSRKYQNQRGPRASRFYREFQEETT
jgi:dCTP deaminase